MRIPAATAQAAVHWIGQLYERLRIPGLATFGVSLLDVPTIVEKAKKASSMRGNPIELTDGELSQIVQQAL